MARLPTVGGDSGNWGTVLNEYLGTAHNADGTLKLDVQTIADLKSTDVTTLTDKQQALVAGYYAPGDQGGGPFYYDAGSSDADNGGTIFQPDAGAGRWKRIYSGAVNVKWFGLALNGSDETAKLQSAINAVTGNGTMEASIYFPGENSSIALVPTSGNTAITAKTCRLIGEGCVIDVTGMTDDQIAIDLGNHDSVFVRKWQRGAVIKGFRFEGAGQLVWGIQCKKPYQAFEQIYSKNLKSLFKFAMSTGTSTQGPYMCTFTNLQSDTDKYGIYWPKDMSPAGSTISYIRCDFRANDYSVYIDHNTTAGVSLFGAWNFTDCTFDSCAQYVEIVPPTASSWDRKIQVSYVNCWFEGFMRVGSTYGHDLRAGTHTFTGCKWVENGAWTAGSMFYAGYGAYITLIGCEFDLAGSSTTAVGSTASSGASVMAINCRSRDNNRIRITSSILFIGEYRARVPQNVPYTIPWQAITAASSLSELGDGTKHGVLSLRNYNVAIISAFITAAGPAGSYLGLQLKKSGVWKWLDDSDGSLTSGAGKIQLSSSGVVTASTNISANFFTSGPIDTHEYRFVTYGGDNATVASLTDLIISLE